LVAERLWRRVARGEGARTDWQPAGHLEGRARRSAARHRQALSSKKIKKTGGTMRKTRALRAPMRCVLHAWMLAGIGTSTHAQQAPASASASQAPGPAGGSSFNEEFLRINGDQPHADLGLFAFGNQVLPGPYRVDVVLNQNELGRNDVRFDAKEGRRDAA